MAYDESNIFAKILRGELPSFRVYEDDQTLGILDVMPQSDGHTLILPKAPAENIFDLDPAMAAAMIRTTQTVARALRDAFHPDGMLLKQFNGEAAGQTVFHIHMHIIPVYAGQAMRRHSHGMADTAVLERHAEQIRTALSPVPE